MCTCTRSESVNVVTIRRRALVITTVSQGPLGYSHARPVAVYRQAVIVCGCLRSRQLVHQRRLDIIA